VCSSDLYEGDSSGRFRPEWVFAPCEAILQDLDRILWTERVKAGVVWPSDDPGGYLNPTWAVARMNDRATMSETVNSVLLFLRDIRHAFLQYVAVTMSASLCCWQAIGFRAMHDGS
jgi:hypothetical protein